MIEADAKQCPGCNTRIHKLSGCNKMHCEVCNASFCWLCLKIIHDYAHFREGEDAEEGNQCAGQLFVGTEMDEQQGRYVAPGRQRQNQQQFVVRLKACPRCKQRCMKDGKMNHMKCWNCPSRFCYLCSAFVTSTSHFSSKGCKQHSND